MLKINFHSPVLALGIKLGCGTNDLNQYVSHLIVYWVSLMMVIVHCGTICMRSGCEIDDHQRNTNNDDHIVGQLTKVAMDIQTIMMLSTRWDLALQLS